MNKAIQHMAMQLGGLGFKRDEGRDFALSLVGMNESALNFYDWRNRRTYYKLKGEEVAAVVFLEQKDEMEYHKGEIITRVPAGSVMVLYRQINHRTGDKHYQGFFDANGGPLNEETQKLREALFD